TVLDEQPLLADDLMQLCAWVAAYYHHPPGEVYATALPAALRRGDAARLTPPDSWQLTDAGRAVDLNELKRAPRQQQLMARLHQAEAPLDASELAEELGAIRPALKTLQDKAWVERARKAGNTSALAPAAVLNADQSAAVEAAAAGLGRFHPCLVDGVTGSGKTEVYLEVIRRVLSGDEQALVLVPEIALTPQLVNRFAKQLNTEIAVLHSGLTDLERMQAWLRAARGEIGVVIGTRSAVFTPLARPGVMIVDEEHDSSFKQQDGLRYSARDVAVRRAQMLDIPILLGSATPALESLNNALQGRYQHLRLPGRAGGAKPPSMQLIDIRRAKLREGLSEPLIAAMQRHLDADGQVMLFLNRRGFSPILMCHACGWHAECRRCDTRMTYHRRTATLRCHHCGSEQRIPRQCPDCNEPELLPIGMGTERIEQVLQAQFRHIGITRIDRDTTRRKGALQAKLESVNSQASRILIGTQMLAKGHDFPHLSLVGVLDADGGLFGTDFRASEHMAQLITQVAGRAGRAQRAGEVLIQTHVPDHPLLHQLLGEGYDGFARSVLAERQAAQLPPYASMALLRAEATSNEAPKAFLARARAVVEPLGEQWVSLWGPLPAPMERRAGRMRWQLLLQAPRRAQLQGVLKLLSPRLYELPEARKVRWSLDVDPIDML
ncbi:MAG: primosomal protein N', partial [Nevskiales bacterium]